MKFSIGSCLPLAAASFLQGCVQLHSVQISDIDNRSGFQRRPVDVKVSEVGIDVAEAGSVAKGLTRNKTARKDVDSVANVIQMFQMGPHTGLGVFDETYAEPMLYKLYEACPSGKLGGVVSIRETRKYPVISGEIVKMTGSCLAMRTKQKNRNSDD